MDSASPPSLFTPPGIPSSATSSTSMTAGLSAPTPPPLASAGLAVIASAGGVPKRPPLEKGPSADKSCKACRTRKVKCDRSWPKCARCREKHLECTYGALVPVEFIKNLSDDTARVAQLEARIASLETDLASQNFFLPSAADLSPSIGAAFSAGAACPEEAIRWMDSVEEEQDRLEKVENKMLANGEVVNVGGSYVGRLSLMARRAKPSLRRSFSLHLLDAFFNSCCSKLPVFRPWEARISSMVQCIDELDPPTRVAVTAFCAMGARSTPHSALLGISSAASADPRSVGLSGIRRNQACRALEAEAIELYEKLEVGHDLSVKSFEASIAMMQMFIHTELIPRRSRSMVRTAYGQFKDLQDSFYEESERDDLVKRLGLPLVHGDAITSAYARRAPSISESDLKMYFKGLKLPNFAIDELATGIAQFIRSGEEPNHMQLSAASMVILRWLVTCQREVARMSCNRASQQALAPSEIVTLWSALDQIHQSIQNLQHYLINLDRLPPGCEADGTAHLHLRFITRMDREVDNVTWLVHSLIVERREGCHGVRDELGVEWPQESERRVRKGLKLAAFYFELYSVSLDPNQTYFLAWQLELIPSWTLLAVQRYGEVGGPATRDVELTETELDWLEKGLGVATFYHPVAERRLIEILSMRRAPREDSLPSRATLDRPKFAFPDAMKHAIRSAVPAWG
ncbi:hypothetical protein BCR35DRAFT_304581 [Leucosporidium creatinivorum]|uniref:Zn(2)-C6 fungal-type domain-containing protein n=1 Tax=Leucosporidium creatinivorum TaxID=106004 RepID=A0A1Y2F8T0_9BASI|nr:hypothetical protein BCR35DRAFT_304581 [Leucosporidium creatinivorum]